MAAFCVALLVVPLPALIASLICGAPGGVLLLSVMPIALGVLGLCFVVPWLEGPSHLLPRGWIAPPRPRRAKVRSAPRDDGDIRPIEIRQRLMYVLLLSVLLPRVIFTHSFDDGAVAMFVWSGVGLDLMRRSSRRIPQAIVWRPRQWSNALLEHLGRAPIACGARAAIPWDLRMLSPHPGQQVSEPAGSDTGRSRDLVADLSPPRKRTSHS